MIITQRFASSLAILFLTLWLAASPARGQEKTAGTVPATPTVKPASTPGPEPASPSPAASPAAAPAAESTPGPEAVASPAPATAPAEPRANNWAAGVIGLVMLGAILFYGLRYARQKGITVADALKKMGVEMPQDAVGNTVPLKSVAPAPAPLPPLPSLTDLPAAGPARSGAVSGIALPAAGGVRAEAPNFRTGEPRLVGIGGAVEGETFLLGEPLTIGRDMDNLLPLPGDSAVSRRHARIECSNGKWTVADMGSSNGTFVNGQRIPGMLFLHPGDEVQVGGARFRFEGGG